MPYSIIAPGAVPLVSKVDGVDSARGKDDRSGGLRQIALAGPRAGGLVVKGPQGSRNLVVSGNVCGAVFRGRDCQV